MNGQRSTGIAMRCISGKNGQMVTDFNMSFITSIRRRATDIDMLLISGMDGHRIEDFTLV